MNADKMNADRVNRWLTLGANVGVVIGLILLLIEIDQNNDLARAQIHQTRADSWGDFRLTLGDSEHLLSAWEKFRDAGGPQDPDALDKLDYLERMRVRQYLLHRYSDYDNLFYQYKQGYLDEEYYVYRVVPSINSLAPSWHRLRTLRWVRPSFVDEVNRITSESQ